MTVLIDPPRWPAHGRIWSHLVSDASLAELHAFAAAQGIPERGFDHDHYDVPGERYDDLVSAGAVPVDSRELLRRLGGAGLRRPKRDRRVGSSTTRLRIATVPWSDPAAERLRAAQNAEVRERYDGEDTEPGVAPSATDVTEFLLAYDGEVAVACGGLRRLDETSGELKRMYVDPAVRGRGVGRAVVTALEAAGRRHGWTRLYLETGDRLAEAIALYTRCGFQRIENFGPYIGVETSVCFAKDL